MGADGLKRYEKVQLVADRQPVYVGFQADLDANELRVPAERLARVITRFRALVAEFRDAPMSPRAAAEAGGHFASIVPAFPMARPLAGLCVLALQGLISWREALKDGASAIRAMEFFIEHGEALNGRRFLGPTRRYVLEGDYSPQAIGGVVRGGVELLRATVADGDVAPCWSSPPLEVPPGTESPGELDLVVAAGHTATDARAIEAKLMSSALGEARVAERLVDIVLKHAPVEALRGAELTYLTDASAFADAYANGYSPSAALHTCLWSMQLKMARAGGTLVVRWRSRETAGGRLMDHLGKFVDNSCWILNFRVLREQVEPECLRSDRYARVPTIDGAADDESRRYDIYVSRVYCPEGEDAQGNPTPASSAVDFLRQGAWFAAQRRPDGRPALLYFNVPFGMMQQLISLVREYALDCVIVYPLWPRPWRAALDLLPLQCRGKLSESLGTLFVAGRRAAPGQRNSARMWGAGFVLVNFSDMQRAEAQAKREARWQTREA
jgi:hypothetical protein